MTFRDFSYDGLLGVQVDVGAGSVSVEAGPFPNTIEGSVNAGADVDDVLFRLEADQLHISAPPSLFRHVPVHVRLSVPPDLSYVVRTGAAVVTFTAAISSAKISTGSGDVSLDQVRDLDCSTASGSVAVGRLTGRAGRIRTGSGDVRVSTAQAPVSAKSGSGDILIRSLEETDLEASSGSGDITVPSTSGSVDLRSASGSLTVGVADDLPVWLDLHSVSGAVRIALRASPEPTPGEPYVRVRARTASGEIAVYRA